VIDTEIGSLEVDNVDLGKPPLRIALFGLFGIDNFGNDGSMEAMIDFLQRVRPDAQLTCICGDPRAIERTHSIPAVQVNLPGHHGRLFRVLDLLLLRLPRTVELLMKTIRKARQIDLLIIPGTGILEEPSHRLKRMHWTLFLWCAAARISRKKIAFVSVGAQPINNALVRWFLGTASRMADYRSFRSESSRQCMGKVGVDVKGDPVYPDIAFGLPEPTWLPKKISNSGNSLTVGLGLMSLLGWYNYDMHQSYIDKMAEFSLWLARKGHRVQLLVADKSDRGSIDDILRTIMKKDPSLLGASILSEHIVCSQDLMRQIALTDVVISSRFHNMVYALKLGKPVISLGYSEKHDALMAEAGLAPFCQTVDGVDIALLQEQFLDLLKNRDAYERGVREANAQFQERLSQQEQVLASRFLGGRRIA
jgi:polysaccharide pyruvyl transferase WcaK-like protein